MFQRIYQRSINEPEAFGPSRPGVSTGVAYADADHSRPPFARWLARAPLTWRHNAAGPLAGVNSRRRWR